MTDAYPLLFSPVKLGSHQLRNRIMRTPTSTSLAEGGKASNAMVEYYSVLARGGVGSIVCEGLRIRGDGPGNALRLLDPAGLDGLRRLTDGVRAEGAAFIVQIYHGGRQQVSPRPETLWSPSDISCKYSGGSPHAMTLEEIEFIIGEFVNNAEMAMLGGFDGIEIHGGQGHLIQQFMSPLSNARSDEYGGSLENRSRFALEVLRRVRARIGPAAILGYRFGIDELVPGGLTVEDSVGFAKALDGTGLADYISLTQSNFESIDQHLPDNYYPYTPYRDLHARVKASVKKLVVVAGTRVVIPENAEQLLATGTCDIVGLGRPLISDPRWPLKAKAGRSADIRRCISCNQCWDWASVGGSIRCAINPTVGKELKFGPIVKSDRMRRVTIIGGGPGGLEAARVCALRGHAVTLWEQSKELGGKLRAAASVPRFEHLGFVVEYLAPQILQAGVELRLGRRATVQDILADQPDTIIVATGATPFAPAVPGDGTVPVLTSVGPLDFDGLVGEQVVVMDEDGHWWAAAVAEAAARSGKIVTFVTRFFEVFRELPAVTRISVLRSLDTQGVRLVANTEVARVEAGGVVLRQVQSGRQSVLSDVAAVVWIGQQRVDDRLGRELRQAGHQHVRIIGDAYAPRRLPNALEEAHAAAREI